MRQRNIHAHAATIGTLTQCHRLAGGETDIAAIGFDAAVIFNFIRDEKTVAAMADFDLSVINDARQRRWTVEHPTAAGILRRHTVRGRNDEAGGADERVWPKIKTRRIEQHHNAVRMQVAVNLRGALAADAIPDDCASGRLVESCGLARTDIEILPVQYRAVASGDTELRAIDGERRMAALHSHAGGIGKHVCRETKDR